MKLIPFSDEWKTGIALPLKSTSYDKSSIFPQQEYDWKAITGRLAEYVDIIVSKHKQA